MRLILLIVALSACGTGSMRQATLVGQCANNDAACARSGPLAPIAIGSRFYPEVSTGLDGTSTPNLILESTRRDVIDVIDGALVGVSAGTSAVLISTDDGSVVDFLHIWVAPVTTIALTRRDGERLTDSLGLIVGEHVSIVPSVFHGTQKLAGEPDATWSVDNPNALAILHDGTQDRRRLRAQAPGKATITVAVGNATTKIDVEVMP